MVCTCLVYRNVCRSVLLAICISTCELHSSGHLQWIRERTCNALMCLCLIHIVTAVCVHVLCECVQWVYRACSMCSMTLVCVVQLPLQHVAWLVCGVGLVRGVAAVWRSGLLLQRKAYVGVTGQAVQGSHQNELLIRSDTNRNCSCRKMYTMSEEVKDN